MSNPVRAVALGLVLTSILGACSSEPADPAAARRERVETRLRSTYSTVQARCVLARLDAPTIAALDQATDLPAASPALRRYSAALRACVVPDAPSSRRPATTITSGP